MEKRKLKAKLNKHETPYEKFISKRKEIEEKYVSNYISKYVDTFITSFPVFISAQTGSGKNYFIENYLIKRAVKENFKILLLSNRIATDIAQKKRISIIMNCYYELDRKYKDAGWKDVNSIGNITIMTYQSFLNNRFTQHYDFKYVVVDEAHYFWSDSSFSSETEKILDRIVRDFQDSIRIYMTASPENIYKILMDKENVTAPIYRESVYDICISRFACEERCKFEQFYKWKTIYMCDKADACKHKVSQDNFQTFIFKRNYSYIEKIISFSDENEIIDKIKASSKSEKWLIFVDSRFIGDKYKVRVNETVFITADNKSIEKEAVDCFSNIVTDEQYKERVLITTSVLDNGINLKDSSIKNIIIYADNLESFIQMLGRVRITSSAQKIKVYIKDYETKTFEYRIKKYKEIVDAAEYLSIFGNEKFLYNYYNNTESFAIARRISYIDDEGNAHINNIGLSFAINRIEELGKIIALKESNEITTFAEYVAKNWLNLDIKVDIITDYKNAVYSFLDSYIGNPIKGEKLQESFCFDLKEKYIKAFGRIDQPKRFDKEVALSNLLSKADVPYIIKDINDEWIVEKIETKEEI